MLQGSGTAVLHAHQPTLHLLVGFRRGWRHCAWICVSLTSGVASVCPGASGHSSVPLNTVPRAWPLSHCLLSCPRARPCVSGHQRLPLGEAKAPPPASSLPAAASRCGGSWSDVTLCLWFSRPCVAHPDRCPHRGRLGSARLCCLGSLCALGPLELACACAVRRSPRPAGGGQRPSTTCREPAFARGLSVP